ncbi:MAG: serine/threonine-protein kinase, partial [Polyangiaceae bacterium]
VYEGEHTSLGSRVAIKMLHPALARHAEIVERFLQEARVAAQIRSPHVVSVIDVDRTPEGHAYIVMELLDGEPLASLLERQRTLPVEIACEYMAQILSALEVAHALGIIHRDLKPENVVVTFAGAKPVLKLIDFGIAKAKSADPHKSLTVAGVVMGTAEYMAPEQARSAMSVDARADIYAAGVMLYEMIAGTRPVQGAAGQDARIIALKVERGEIVPLIRAAPGTPGAVTDIVHHAMAALPEMRFPTASDMRAALEGLDHSVHTVRTPPLATALEPAPYASAFVPAPPSAEVPRRSPRPRGAGRTTALVVLSLLLCASGASILVGMGVWTFSTGSPAVWPVTTVTSPFAPAPPFAPALAPSGARAAAVPAPAVPALDPTRPRIAHEPAPAVPGKGRQDAAASPQVFPTSFPGIDPSAIPHGLALPTSLPSAFPSSLPSGLEAIFSAWRPPPAPPSAH